MDLEDVNDELRDVFLSLPFREVLEQVYARKRVELPLEHVNTVYVSAKYNPQTFPCVELVGDMSRNRTEDGTPTDVDHEIVVFFHNHGDDEENLQRTVTRFLRATREYFMANPYLVRIGSAPIVIGDDSHSPFIPPGLYEGRPFVKSGTIQLFVRTFD